MFLGSMALTKAIHVELADEALELGVAEVGRKDMFLEERRVENRKGSTIGIP